MQYVPGTPTQGALYHLLNTRIAMNHSGLGPNNVGAMRFSPMIGKNFQKPLSGSTTAVPVITTHAYR